MGDRPMDDTSNEERADDGGENPQPPFPPPPPETRRWWQWPVARDPDDGKISGVVAGVSRAYGFDLRTTRIAVVIAGIVLPAVVLLYIAAWILLPGRPEEAAPLRDVVLDRRRLPLMLAIAIVLVVGGVGSFGSWFVFGGLGWGVALIAVGVMLWAVPNLGSRSASTTTPAPPGNPPPGPTGWTTPAPGPGGTGAPSGTTAPSGTPPFGTTPFGTVPFTATRGSGTTAPTAPAPPTRPIGLPPRRPPGPVAPRQPKVPIARFAVLGALIISGIAAIGDAFDWWNASVFGFTVVSLAIVMLGILASAIVNRSWALFPFFVLLLPPMVFLLITQPNLDGGVGERRVVPTTIDEAEQSRTLGAGRLTIDLTELPDEAGTVTTVADVGYGRLAVIVPDDVVLVVTTEIGAGHVVVDGVEIVSGLRQGDSRTIPTDASEAVPADQRQTIELDLEVGAGEIAIIHSAAR